MSRLDRALRNDLQALTLLRDELVLHSHLLHSEARTHWQQLEQDWERLRGQLRRAGQASEQAGEEASAAVRLLLEALRQGYVQIRGALQI